MLNARNVVVASVWNSDLSIYGNCIFAPYLGNGSWLRWLCMWALYEFVTANPQGVSFLYSHCHIHSLTYLLHGAESFLRS